MYCIYYLLHFFQTLLTHYLFDTIGEIKDPLLYCFRFEMILNSWLLSQQCRQRERTSPRDGHRLPSNSALKIIRRRHLYVMEPKGSFYMCGRFTFERIHNTKEQIYFNERAENHKATERLF